MASPVLRPFVASLPAEIQQVLTQFYVAGSSEPLALSPALQSIIFTAEQGTIALVLDATHLPSNGFDAARQQITESLRAIPGVLQVQVVATAHNNSSIRVEPKSAPKSGVNPPSPKPIPGVKKIIAVGSGKGGVGKSTVASNLAVALAQNGLQMGLVDADIYGPSIARMMGISGEPEVIDNRMVPPVAHGVRVMSMGLLLKDDMPVVWRGPMISKALQQLMLGADWRGVDVLVVDLPPGTGDIHLSIAQNFLLDGIIMVTTPQDVAMLDVQKAIQMFRKVNVPVFGIVKNMSYLQMPDGSRMHPFGQGNVEAIAEALGVPVLAEFPLDATISSGGDAGTPVAADGDSDVGKQYQALAKMVMKA